MGNIKVNVSYIDLTIVKVFVELVVDFVKQTEVCFYIDNIFFEISLLGSRENIIKILKLVKLIKP